MTGLNLPALWAQSWNEELEATQRNITIPTSEWRAAGRATKANPNKEDGAWWVENGADMLARFVDWRRATSWVTWITPQDEPAIELGLNVMFGDVPVKLFIDWVADQGGGELVVVDYKSGSREPNPMQLGLYASALELATGQRPKYGAYFSFRKGELHTPTVLDRFSVGFFTEVFGQFSRALEQGVFLPNLDAYCDSCDVRRFCHAAGGADAHLFDPLAKES